MMITVKQMPINEVQILPFSILNLGQFLENGCLHSSLNHGLRLFVLVEDFGIHSSEMSCNAEVKADIFSTVLNLTGV